MSAVRLEELSKSAEELNSDELLALAQRLIDRARVVNQDSEGSQSLFFGVIELDEDPMEIQERLRRE